MCLKVNWKNRRARSRTRMSRKKSFESPIYMLTYIFSVMNYLVDTHIFLWSFTDPDKLSANVKLIFLDESNEIWVSQISLWEISLKYSLGKLVIKGMTPDELESEIENSFYKVFNLRNHDILTAYKLPRTNHLDPFDRMLIW
jgi:PIN domain nuclease of toxin-antitoxin system